MRTLHTGLRVRDADASVAFYAAIGFTVVGKVAGTPIGDLTILKLPDDEFGTLELVCAPTAGEVTHGDGLHHLVVQTESLASTLGALAASGYTAGAPESPGGMDGPLVAWATDPDGYRIELTQWPPGHPAGFTSDDFVA